jgi:hypothetical protein
MGYPSKKIIYIWGLLFRLCLPRIEIYSSETKAQVLQLVGPITPGESTSKSDAEMVSDAPSSKAPHQEQLCHVIG